MDDILIFSSPENGKIKILDFEIMISLDLLFCLSKISARYCWRLMSWLCCFFAVAAVDAS